MPKSKHLDRENLIKAAMDSEKKWPSHLKSCPDCRELVDLLKTYQVSGTLPLAEPPAGWSELATAIPGKAKSPGLAGLLPARLIFDSWATSQPIGVRGLTTDNERRLCFEAGGIHFDLRGEHKKSKWTFVARIKIDSDRPEPIVLLEGKKSRQPDSSGIFQWAASKPPGEMSLSIGDNSIQIPRLSWKKLRPKRRPKSS